MRFEIAGEVSKSSIAELRDCEGFEADIIVSDDSQSVTVVDAPIFEFLLSVTTAQTKAIVDNRETISALWDSGQFLRIIPRADRKLDFSLSFSDHCFSSNDGNLLAASIGLLYELASRFPDLSMSDLEKIQNNTGAKIPVGILEVILHSY